VWTRGSKFEEEGGMGKMDDKEERGKTIEELGLRLPLKGKHPHSLLW
jgi:hypothetical protein